MNNLDQQYKALIQKILDEHQLIPDKSRGTNRLHIPHHVINCPVSKENFQILTCKKVSLKNILWELIWFLNGRNDIEFLTDKNVNIWNKDYENFHKRTGKTNLGQIYGPQWRNFNGVDQLNKVVDDFMTNPYSSRSLLSSWNPSEITPYNAALPPCHWAWQLVSNNGGFDLIFYMRSCDVFLGLPYNFTSYSLLGIILSDYMQIPIRNVTAILTNVHIYEPHVDAAKKVLDNPTYPIPTLETKAEYNTLISYKDYHTLGQAVKSLKAEMFTLKDYEHAGYVKASMIAPKK
jgi:thymidylate synthase